MFLCYRGFLGVVIGWRLVDVIFLPQQKTILYKYEDAGLRDYCLLVPLISEVITNVPDVKMTESGEFFVATMPMVVVFSFVCSKEGL